jgi:sugar/nucleoside kinase (ribokinase family)
MAAGVVPGLIHVAGNAVVDLLVRGSDTQAGPSAESWGANTQLLSTPMETVLGGCGAAPAYILGRLGHTVHLNTNIGNDAIGSLLDGWLKEASVEIVGPTRAAATAVHVIHLSAGGRRSYYYAGNKVSWRHSLKAETPEWFLASGYGAVDAQDVECLAEVFTELRRRGSRIAFDPSPWFSGRAAPEQMAALWPLVDGLIGTEEELGHWHGAATPHELAARVLQTGPEWVVVKRGRKGAAFADRRSGAGNVRANALEEANTVGAGDSFNARLLAGLCRGEELAQAVGAAVELATRVVDKGRGALGAFECAKTGNAS